MTIKDMRDVIATDPETKHLQLLDCDVIKVYQYVIDKNEHKEYDGYKPILKTDPYVEIIYVPTDEQRRKVQQLKIKEHLDLFDSETYLQDAMLEKVYEHTDARKKILQTAKKFIDTYDGKTFQKGLYLYGPYGTGKSYLLSAIAKELAFKGYEVIFAYMPDISRGIKQSIDEGTLEKRINILKQTDVLILDDLGAEYMSAWFRDDVFVPIIQYRQSAGLPLFVSSNYKIAELTKVFANSTSEIESVKAARLTKRLLEMTMLANLE